MAAFKMERVVLEPQPIPETWSEITDEMISYSSPTVQSALNEISAALHWVPPYPVDPVTGMTYIDRGSIVTIGSDGLPIRIGDVDWDAQPIGIADGTGGIITSTSTHIGLAENPEIKELKDEIQALKDEIENLKMLFLEN